jgi:hypothetical protein
MIDGREPATHLPVLVAFLLAGQATMVGEGIENVGPANRDDIVPIVGSVTAPAIGRTRCHGAS